VACYKWTAFSRCTATRFSKRLPSSSISAQSTRYALVSLRKVRRATDKRHLVELRDDAIHKSGGSAI
jgi:hypothetical protein